MDCEEKKKRNTRDFGGHIYTSNPQKPHKVTATMAKLSITIETNPRCLEI
jgi:hypothetical protein